MLGGRATVWLPSSFELVGKQGRGFDPKSCLLSSSWAWYGGGFTASEGAVGPCDVFP